MGHPFDRVLIVGEDGTTKMTPRLAARRKPVPVHPDDCPECGAGTANVQGLTACPECGWTTI
jgi:ribosomal protein S27AE